MPGIIHPRPLQIPGHGGLALNVWDHGGEGPAVLLCHCTGGLGRLWDPVVAHSGAGCRFLAVDARGHGLSGRPGALEDCRLQYSGEDLLRVVDALALGQGLRGVGHSGGGAHLLFAELLRPGLFQEIILIDPIAGPPEVLLPIGLHLAQGARRRRNTFSSREEARARLCAKPPMNSWCGEALDAYVEHGLLEQDGVVHLRCPGEVEAWFYEQECPFEAYDRLKEIDSEVLLLSGVHSPLMSLVRAQRDRLKHSRVRIIEEAGHFLPQERPEALAGVLSSC